MRRALPRFLLYLVFFLAAGSVFLFLTFPSERLDGLANARLGRFAGALRVEGSRFRFPLSLAADRLVLATEGKDLDLGRMTVTPSLPSLFGGKGVWRVALDGEWGVIPARLTLEKTGPWKAEVAGAAIDLARHPVLAGLPIALEGKCAFSLTLTGIKGSLEGGAGQGEMILSGAAAGGKLLTNLGLSTLRFSRVDLPWTLDKGILTLREAKVEGDLMGTVNGVSRLAPDRWPLSSLDLTLALRPSAEARSRLGPAFALLGGAAASNPTGGVIIRVTGTVAEPSLALNLAR